MLEVESIQFENLEEADQGQLHAIHLNDNAVAAIRNKLGAGPSLSHCEECGEEIPTRRRAVIKGCRTCIFCQEFLEAQSKAKKTLTNSEESIY